MMNNGLGFILKPLFYKCNPLPMSSPNTFCSLFQSSRKKVLKWVSFIQMVVILFRN